MKERPINMRADEVRAILAGRKTQFRRVIREVPTYKHLGRSIMDWSLSGVYTDQHGNHWLDVQTDVDDYSHNILSCPFGAPGDRLWVRECWAYVPSTSYRCSDGVIQTADPDDPDMSAVYAAGWELSPPSRWRSSVHMPRWASRITLEVVTVRVERLHDISEENAIAEGCSFIPWEGTSIGHYLGGVHPIKGNRKTFPTPMQAFRSLWQSINGPRSWDENPFVWAVEFRRLEGAL